MLNGWEVVLDCGRRGKREVREGQHQGRKRYRGQTQTQYIAFNGAGGKERTGTAEAVAAPDESRATVSEYPQN